MNEKINYQIILDKTLEELQEKNIRPTLLLHACCAPCSSYVLEYLEKYFDITIYYYNPNIYPQEEYERRLNELKNYLIKSKSKTKLIMPKYVPEDYYNAIIGNEDKGEKSIRCYQCYQLRMEKAANYAKENNFDYFTATLSISPHKNSAWINEIGQKLENKYSIKYLYADFKKKNGYKRSLELSQQYQLYRQTYCGCKFTYNQDNYLS